MNSGISIIRDLIVYRQARKIYDHVIANEFDLTNHACRLFYFSAKNDKLVLLWKK